MPEAPPGRQVTAGQKPQAKANRWPSHGATDGSMPFGGAATRDAGTVGKDADRKRLHACAIVLTIVPVTGSADIDVSSLAPAGMEADVVARLFWIMTASAGVVWLVVLGIALYAMARPGPRDRRVGHWLILGGGVAAPVLVLGALLLYGLMLMPRLREPPPDEDAHVAVTGEQWWWRVRYAGFNADERNGDANRAGEVVLANEIHLPVGERVRFVFDSPDVIHSFWVPSLAGKVDMIPGRTTTVVLEPTRSGVFRGVCAEYCGTSHAHMRFVVVVTARADFDRWLRAQATPAQVPRTLAQQRGHAAFLRNGCGACHAIRGTPAHGAVGPDLTHVGSRLELAAGTLPNDAGAFAKWIADAHALKPGALMPPFATLPPAELQAMALYLDSLQ
jgi:cytochrome c oxidase subunit 2